MLSFVDLDSLLSVVYDILGKVYVNEPSMLKIFETAAGARHLQVHLVMLITRNAPST